MNFRPDPWGHIDWIMPRVGERPWHTILCASAEDRSIAVAEWAAVNLDGRSKHHVLRIDDLPSRHWDDVERKTDLIEIALRRSVAIERLTRAPLLESASVWAEVARDAARSGSVLVDITAMPKRVFLFLLKSLLDSDQLRDLVVTYSRPAKYPEGALAEAALPPAFMPGFAREDDHKSESTLIVGVGYIAFDLEELLEQRNGKTIKFLLPFPPASPATRRNWRLLKSLHPTLQLDTEVRRVHSLDMFEALRWIKAVGNASSGSFDMLPLGPKPHAVAMALAHRYIGSRAQITYAQPTIYRPDYSEGIGKTADAKVDISAYCLRRDGQDTFIDC